MAKDEGSSQVAAQPTGDRARRTPTPNRPVGADLPTAERRGWLSHGIAALAISALGLAVAGSVSLTTSAQPVAAPAPAAPAVEIAVADPIVQSGSTSPSSATERGDGQDAGQTSAAMAGTLAAFGRPMAVVDSARTPRLQAAVVKERAAQRAEILAESAEDVSQAARDAGGVARSQELASTERATREAAVKLAQDRLAAAIRKRVAAEVERKGAENAATADSTTSTTPTTPGVDASVPAGGGSSSPVPGAVIGAHFGQYGLWSRYHTGLDFRAGFGTPIKAVADGVVVYAGNSGDWSGNHVAVRHAGGMTTMSSHMSSMAVSAGQSVKAGQVIGYVGATGRAFGAHLHFELYPAGVRYGDVYRAVNPVPWLRSIGVGVN
ncbi:M23 family metallopeptidase [Nocardioides sp.]|uniref:M23 family metallopeptidase n=1 Tax=Nocardioides sp. TaxID=35761 RepID=UPI002D7EAACF|nr:M23 family metallopeptidase [Nocardioides sp.]